MNNETENQAWLFCEGTDENRPLVGNRAGFEELRSSIEDLLSGDGKNVVFIKDGLGFNELILQENPDPVEPLSLRGQIVILSILSIFGLVLILGISALGSIILSLFN